MNNNKQHYTPDGMHPEDAIYKVKTFVKELQNVQETYIKNLVQDLNLNKDGEEWLFDYIYNSDETVDDFSHYLELFKRKYEDMLFNDKGGDFIPTDFAEFSPMLHMSSYEPELETAFPSYFCDKEFEDLALNTITIEKTNNDKV
jgi:hypothetical protein